MRCSIPTRNHVVLVIVLAFLASSLVVAESPEGPRRNRTAAPRRKGIRTPQTIREGTRLEEVVGRFRMTGDRTTFRPEAEDARPLVVLENLLLDRITSAEDFHSKLVWRVSGLVTQYRGANYLLLTHAVARSEARRRRTTRTTSPKEPADEQRPAQRP